MKINFLPSLEHLAVAKIAIAVCYDPTFKALLKKMEEERTSIRFDISEEGWDILQCKVSEILRSLELTWAVKKKVIGVMKPMICQIDGWKNDHNDILDLDLVHNGLRWKAEGTIDRKNTAKALIRDETIEIHSRFMLACNYCLADDVKDLWNRMSDTQRAKFNHSEDYDATQFWIVRVWIDSIKRGTGVNWKWLARKCSTHGGVLNESILALPNFFDKLSSRQKRLCLRGVAQQSRLQSHDLRACLPQMNEDGQRQFLEGEAVDVLYCLLTWPLQGLFMDAAESLWSHIPQRDFRSLLNFILHCRISLGWSDFDYFELFQSFWRHSPVELKEFVRTDKIFPSVMLVLNHVQNEPFSRQQLLELLVPNEVNFD